MTLAAEQLSRLIVVPDCFECTPRPVSRPIFRENSRSNISDRFTRQGNNKKKHVLRSINSHPVFVAAPTLQTTVVQNRACVVLSTGDAAGRPALSKIHKSEALTHVGGREPSRDCVSKTELSVRFTTTGDGTQREKTQKQTTAWLFNLLRSQTKPQH